MCNDHSRRDFIKTGVTAGLGTLMFPGVLGLSRAWGGPSPAPRGDEDPHFFVLVAVPGGMDPTYLFDARPLELTRAGKLQNYLGEEPTLWEGRNGGRLLTTSVARPLHPFRDDFSVLNGVVMTTSFDGHEQNMNYLLAGDPFGGESFVPQLNRAHPLDAIFTGDFREARPNVSNSGGTVPLRGESAEKLVAKLKSAAPVDPRHPLIAFMQSRLDANSRGPGRFSQGAAAMRDGFRQAPGLSEMLKQISFGGQRPDPQPDEDAQFLGLMAEIFRKGAARAAVIAVNVGGTVDAHAQAAAMMVPRTLGDVMSKVALVIRTLKETPFDSRRSLFDVTTFMITSEFGRTMRQKNRAIDDTGTDHNPLCNTILIGGKGIKGGQVIGASDTQSSTEPLSQAHLELDPDRLKILGRPFDFAAMAPREDRPGKYDAADYLNAASVVNTVYSLFGVGSGRHRSVKRDGGPAPVLRGLLA